MHDPKDNKDELLDESEGSPEQPTGKSPRILILVFVLLVLVAILTGGYFILSPKPPPPKPDLRSTLPAGAIGKISDGKETTVLYDSIVRVLPNAFALSWPALRGTNEQVIELLFFSSTIRKHSDFSATTALFSAELTEEMSSAQPELVVQVGVSPEAKDCAKGAFQRGRIFVRDSKGGYLEDALDLQALSLSKQLLVRCADLDSNTHLSVSYKENQRSLSKRDSYSWELGTRERIVAVAPSENLTFDFKGVALAIWDKPTSVLSIGYFDVAPSAVDQARMQRYGAFSASRSSSPQAILSFELTNPGSVVDSRSISSGMTLLHFLNESEQQSLGTQSSLLRKYSATKPGTFAGTLSKGEMLHVDFSFSALVPRTRDAVNASWQSKLKARVIATLGQNDTNGEDTSQLQVTNDVQ